MFALEDGAEIPILFEIFIYNRASGISPDALIPNCPDCHNMELLPIDAPEEACLDPKALLKQNITSCQTNNQPENGQSMPIGGEWYIPGADPYSFWTTVILPYWPERFQNINFRRFFESTLRREFPAHIGIRICWLDPKQMIQFEYYYRNWLEAISGKQNCNLQEIKACLIELLFDLKTVYPPATLQEDGCAPGSGDPDAVLLDYTQLG